MCPSYRGFFTSTKNRFNWTLYKIPWDEAWHINYTSKRCLVYSFNMVTPQSNRYSLKASSFLLTCSLSPHVHHVCALSARGQNIYVCRPINKAKWCTNQPIRLLCSTESKSTKNLQLTSHKQNKWRIIHVNNWSSYSSTNTWHLNDLVSSSSEF